MDGVDQRGKLDEEPFSYTLAKDNKVLISWFGRQVTILRDKESERFQARMAQADRKGKQLIMAKATGNFKHGNEK